MLDLHSPRWAELSHAFGSAEDVPRLLEALEVFEEHAERAELWFGLWATLCHEGAVNTASYAAAPHLLRITAEQGMVERRAAAHLITAIETGRQRAGSPPIPGDLVADYAMAVESLPLLVAELASVPWDAATAQVLAAALLVGKRQPQLAQAVLALGDE